MRPLVAVAAALAAGPALAAEPRPSVLFLFADDLRADAIASLGNRHIRTPNLDRLVRRGVAFDRAYMQGGLREATCIPSRAMLLSGASLFRVDTQLRCDKTWPEAFADAGYATFLTGKWHNGRDSLARIFPEARAVFVGGMADPLRAELLDVAGGKPSKRRVTTQHACAEFADEAERFIGRQKGPFFCYVPFDAPHDPHVVPAGYPVSYAAADQPLPANFLPRHPFDNGELAVRDELLLPTPRTEAAVKSMNAEYYRYITYLDSQVGRVLDALDASPHAKSTYVVFSADSGVARGSHGLIGKQNLYEHSVRVPLVVAGPGVARGARSGAMCYLFDVLPTLGKRCGVAAPPASEGLDLSAALADPAAPGRASLFFAYKDCQRGLREDRFKVTNYPQVGVTQLFDLRADPDEVTNLADRPEHAPRVAKLLARLAAEQARFGDAQSPSAPGRLPSQQRK